MPLDLPGARGGLPVPVQLVYTERGIGAAGLGWDVPLSYIVRDTTIAHRRPMPAAGGGWQAREAITLVLGGNSLDLVPTASGYAARSDAPDILARQQTDGTWVVFDGHGHTYSFTAVAATGSVSMWLLKTVTGVGGSSVVLDYSIAAPTVAGGGGLAVDLTTVSYNPHPTTASCFKNAVSLVYDGDASAPLSLSVLGDRILVRAHKLTAINVKAKATCSDGYVRLRGYNLEYAQDPDTQLPRLSSVKLVGREDKADGATPIPLASYKYGAATNGELRYQLASKVASMDNKRPFTRPLGFVVGPHGSLDGTAYSTNRSILDVTGDGIPDEVEFPVLFTLRWFYDWMHDVAARTWDSSSASFPARPFGLQTLEMPRYQSVSNVDRVWRQAMDVNGDGRVDIIDAGAQGGHWIVYLNTPDPSDPRFTTWVKRSFSIQALAAQLTARGFSFDPNFIPLSERSTVRDKITHRCLHWDVFEWDPRPWSEGHCSGPEVEFGLEMTYTEWEVTDVNGDGFPDVVFNSSPLKTSTTIEPDPGPPANPSGKNIYVVRDSTTASKLPAANEIDAVLNVLGVRFSLDSQPFAAPVKLVGNDRCGVARWTATDASHQELSCSIIDVNGDGIPDRVNSKSVFLGTGVVGTSGAFTPNALLTLPGALATQINQQAAACAPPATGDTTFTTSQTAGLRDLTGDGIPDYFTADGAGGGTVRVGTSTGFLAPIPIDGMFMSLSSQTEDCGGNQSTTTAGLFDVDGDGKPDVLTSDGSVYEVVGSSGVIGAPESGRLVQIDNGFGATTTVTYRSAKVLAGSGAFNGLHQVPFPEVVVSAVETTKTQGGGTLLAKTQYAYGGAEMVFDPVRDGFHFPGYHRQVALQVPTEQSEGIATITDFYEPTNTADPYDLASASLTTAQRYARYLRLGRVSDVTALSGNVGTDPAQLLTVNVATDARTIAGTHYEFDARLFDTTADPAGPEACSETVYPFDYAGSLAFANVDACHQRGFAFATSVESFRGEPGASATSGARVTTRAEVRTIDDLGRVTSVKQLGDTAHTEDDLCVDTEYAVPTGQNERVLTAASTRTVGDCGTAIYAKDTYQYDLLDIGKVSAGLPTAHTVQRRDETGALLKELREYDIVFTPEGNPFTVSTKREDGAVRSVSVNYDGFALVPIVVATDATDLLKQKLDLMRDPLTLNVTATRDPNLTWRSARFDGFDRQVMTSKTQPGDAEGVLSFTVYKGFAGGDSQGPRITTTEFTDPVSPAAAPTATGRTSTTYLDELGRVRLAEQVLGAQYPNILMKVDRSYDSLGRLLFASDPYPSTQDAGTAYGTTRYFNADGTPLCFLRGKGKQARPAPPSDASKPPAATSEDSEFYPMCFSRHFADQAEVVSVQDPASLLAGSPQAGIVRSSYITATGQLLARATWQGATRLEYATFTQDHLGHLASMTRYRDPAAAGSPVTSSWRTDSLGQLLELDEPETAARLNTYSDWGELLETRRSVGGTIKRVIQKFDARSRLIHSEQQSGGVVDPETVHDYAYDTPVQVAPQVTAAHVLGRLAKVSWPTGAATFSYDGWGRQNAQVFTDTQGGIYVEKYTFHGNDSLDTLDMFLPDTTFADEQIKYSYDSAGRGTLVKYTNGSDQRELYKATTIDPFGRVRAAKYGPADYTADYADIGRRLVTQVAVSSSLGSRKVSFGTFDPVGRERSRTELKDGAGTSATTSWTYDALGRLAKAEKTSGGATLLNQAFTYDPLGNLLTVTNTSTSGAVDTTLTYSTNDRDRICRVTFGSGSGTACNVTYDELGGIASQPTPTGTRQYAYLVDGSVRTISDSQGNLAQLRYDAFGEVQQLDVTSSVEPRQDRNFGDLFTQHLEKIGSTSTSVMTRKVPLHDGSVATRHGPAGPWTFEYGEQRGNRFFTDQTGAFVQDVDYQPFGKPTSTGAAPGSQLHSSKQWNFGNALASLGIAQLGARIYDPLIGRFTSRDGLLLPGTNPYAFAGNDPVNSSDPTGLCPSLKKDGTCPTEDETGTADVTKQSGPPTGGGGGSGSTKPPPSSTTGIEIVSGSSSAPSGGPVGTRGKNPNPTPDPGKPAQQGTPVNDASARGLMSAAGTAASVPLQPLPWNKPGGQWGGFYIGTAAHDGIAAYYQAAHPYELVAANHSSIGQILDILAENGIESVVEGLGVASDLRLMPDITNLKTLELYEIKPAMQGVAALAKSTTYMAIFRSVGVNMNLGPSNDPGVNGVIPAPAGWFKFWSPWPGTILYSYIPASPLRLTDPVRVGFRAPVRGIPPGTVRRITAVGVAGYVLWGIWQSARIWFPLRNAIPF